MTKADNASRQKLWQLKRKIKNILAFRWFMKQAASSAKDHRLLKTFLRKVCRHPDATPAQMLSASKWLIYLAHGAPECPANPKDLRPVRPVEIEINAPPSNPEISPDDGDPELEQLLNKLRS